MRMNRSRLLVLAGLLGLLALALNVICLAALFSLWHMDWKRDGGPGQWSITYAASLAGSVVVLGGLFVVHRKLEFKPTAGAAWAATLGTPMGAGEDKVE